MEMLRSSGSLIENKKFPAQKLSEQIFFPANFFR